MSDPYDAAEAKLVADETGSYWVVNTAAYDEYCELMQWEEDEEHPEDYEEDDGPHFPSHRDRDYWT